MNQQIQWINKKQILTEPEKTYPYMSTHIKLYHITKQSSTLTSKRNDTTDSLGFGPNKKTSNGYTPRKLTWTRKMMVRKWLLIIPLIHGHIQYLC